MRHHRKARDAFVRYADAHPKRDGKSWLGACGSLVRRLVRAPSGYETALAAYRKSAIVSKSPAGSVVGSIHFWGATTGNSAGHIGVQIDLDGNIAMASSHLAKSFSPFGLGTNTVQGYGAASGAPYLGWSFAFGEHEEWAVADFGQFRDGKKIAIKTRGANGLHIAELGVAPAKPERQSLMVKRIAAYLNARHLGHTTTAVSTGVRGPVYWRAIQAAGRLDGLYGPKFAIDGVVNARSRLLEQHYAAITRTTPKGA